MSSTQRVAFLASEYPPYVNGGLGTHVSALTTALAKHDVEIDLFVPSWQGRYDSSPPGVEVHDVEIGNPRSDTELWLNFCFHTIARIQQSRESISLIHCHDWQTILAGIRLRKMLNVPLVFSIHLPQRHGPNLAMENLGLIFADHLLVNSKAVSEEIAVRGLPIRSLGVIPNGVELERFMPSHSPSAERYILFVGRLVAQKGVEIALRAFSVLLHRCSDVRLIIVGDGDLALYYQRVGRYLGLASHVSFLGWQTDQALVQLYQGAEVVVMPSFYEPFGIVALEAMACGRPVVATRTGGLAEIIEDGVNGYLVPTGDYLYVAQRIVKLLLEPERAASFGAAARQRASMFGWEKIAARTEQLYRLISYKGEPLTLGEPGSIVDQFIQSVDPDLRILAQHLVSDL